MAIIRRNDTVKVIAGKDKGKTGKVLGLFPDEERAIVEGINFIKRHMKQTRQDQKGGIIQKEAPIQISNLMLVCKNCNRPTKVAIKFIGEGLDKVRVCKKCSEVIA